MEVHLSALTLIFRIGGLPCADREIALREYLGHQPPEVFKGTDRLFIDLGDDCAHLDAGQLRQTVADHLEDGDAFGRPEVELLSVVLSDRPDYLPVLHGHRVYYLTLLVLCYVRSPRTA